MAPKVDKARAEQKERIAADKTFGMKNKNKSKQVQKYIKQITSNLTGKSNKQEQDERKAQQDSQKASQKSALMASLFNQNVDKKGKSYDPVAKKAAKKIEEDAIASGRKLKEADKKLIIEGVANSIRLTNSKGVRMSELGGHPIIQALKEKQPEIWKNVSLLLFIKANELVFWCSDPEESNPTIRCADDVEAEVAPDDRPIEEIIEEKRAMLPPGGTPVTAATFLAWREKKEAERMAAVEEARKDMAKKKGGTGLSALSGRDLFTYDSTLFDVDDEGAVSADEYDAPEDAPEDFDEGEVKLGVGRAVQEADEEGEEEGDAEDEKKDDEGAAGSGSQAQVSSEVPINKDLFLEGGDLPDDLDDLDDLSDD